MASKTDKGLAIFVLAIGALAIAVVIYALTGGFGPTRTERIERLEQKVESIEARLGP